MNGRNDWGRALAVMATLTVLAGPALGQPNKPAAVVNGVAITEAEVDALLKHQPPSATAPTEAQRREMRRAALDVLIQDLVMKQFMSRQRTSKDYLKPNSPEVNQKVNELAEALKKKGSSLAQFLKENGQTEPQMRAEIVQKMRWDAYVSAQISDAQLKAYYDEFKPFFDKVVVRASHILFRIPESAPPAERQAARNRLLALRKEIVDGKIDFAEAAKKYSNCPSKDAGGDLGLFPRKGVVLEPFARAAFALKVGEISDVVETDVGLHLIKVTDRSPGTPSDFAKIKDWVRQVCMMEVGMTILEREYKAARIDIRNP